MDMEQRQWNYRGWKQMGRDGDGTVVIRDLS